MAIVRLEHGAELDLLTAAEVREILAEQRGVGGPQRQWPFNASTLDASGNGSVDIYTVPVDRNFILHRVAISADSYTPILPFINASGWVEVHHNGQMVDFITFAAGIPVVGDWGTEDGIHYAQREKIVLKFFGGPPSGSVTVRGQGTLEPLPLD